MLSVVYSECQLFMLIVIMLSVVMLSVMLALNLMVDFISILLSCVFTENLLTLAGNKNAS